MTYWQNSQQPRQMQLALPAERDPNTFRRVLVVHARLRGSQVLLLAVNVCVVVPAFRDPRTQLRSYIVLQSLCRICRGVLSHSGCAPSIPPHLGNLRCRTARREHTAPPPYHSCQVSVHTATRGRRRVRSR
jgi:hypothetical protein